MRAPLANFLRGVLRAEGAELSGVWTPQLKLKKSRAQQKRLRTDFDELRIFHFAGEGFKKIIGEAHSLRIQYI